MKQFDFSFTEQKSQFKLTFYRIRENHFVFTEQKSQLDLTLDNIREDLETSFSEFSQVQVAADPYTGEYEITPTNADTIIEIRGKNALDNIVVKKIPRNYGLITWDGSKLIVS